MIRHVVVCDSCGKDAKVPSRVQVLLSRNFGRMENDYIHVDLCEFCVEKALQDALSILERVSRDEAISWGKSWSVRRKESDA